MKVGIGILGGGIVGGTLARRLLADRATIAQKTGLDLELVKVAVRDLDRPRNFPAEYATDQPRRSGRRPQGVSLVVELMGGLEPAGEPGA